MYLMNGKNTTVKVKTTDSSDDVLEVSYFIMLVCTLLRYFYSRKLQRKLNYKRNSHTILLCFSRDLTRSPKHGKVMA